MRLMPSVLVRPSVLMSQTGGCWHMKCMVKSSPSPSGGPEAWLQVPKVPPGITPDISLTLALRSFCPAYMAVSPWGSCISLLSSLCFHQHKGQCRAEGPTHGLESPGYIPGQLNLISWRWDPSIHVLKALQVIPIFCQSWELLPLCLSKSKWARLSLLKRTACVQL